MIANENNSDKCCFKLGSNISGFTPKDIWDAYGITNLNLSQNIQIYRPTITIVIAYGSKTITNDVDIFSNTFQIPKIHQFDIYYQNGNEFLKGPIPDNYPTNSRWSIETTLDVQWAHAIAPHANINLVVSKSSSLCDILGALQYASSCSLNSNIISMSWGMKEVAKQIEYDNLYFSNPNIIYVASSGNYGYGIIWPSISPYVLSVGGTTLKRVKSNTQNINPYIYTETAWKGSGGGVSQFVDMPTYQQQIGQKYKTLNRLAPDVSFVADPTTGAVVYTSTIYGNKKGWFVIGGTSLSAPCWAGILALVIQYRKKPFNNIGFKVQTALYNLLNNESIYNMNFRDVTIGSNGSPAGPNFDLTTGLGSPNVNRIINTLISI